MKYQLFIDDLRHPSDVMPKVPDDLIIARTSKEAIEIVKQKGVPYFIYFDHDLGGEDTAMLFVHWLVEEDLDRGIIKDPFSWSIHSANPVGKGNINSLLHSYFNHKFNEG